MRVVRVVNSMWTGGVQIRLMALLPRLRELGADPEICVVRSRGDLAKKAERELGIPVKLVPVEGRLQPPSILRLARHFRERRATVVHSHMYAANIPSAPAAKVAGVPAVVWQNHNTGTYRRSGQRLTDRLLMPLRDRLLCVSDAVALDAAAALRMDRERFEVLPNGLDPAEPEPGVRERIRRELEIEPDAPVVLHAARLHPNKNHEGFLRRWPGVLRDVPSARLLIAGEGETGRGLRELAAELGVADSIRFLGLRRDVPALLAASDVAVLPSMEEGFSNVILEAMAAGLPVVATEAGAAREQLGGRAGVTTATGAMEEFARAVARLLNDRAESARLGAAGRERVLEFGLDAMARRTMEIYESILLRKKRRR